MWCEPPAWTGWGTSHSRVADINVGNASLVTSDVHAADFLAVVIDDTEMDQVVDVEAGRVELLVLKGRIVAVAEHRLDTVEASSAGNPQAVGLKSVNRV